VAAPSGSRWPKSAGTSPFLPSFRVRRRGSRARLTKVAAVELGPHGISVNCVAPEIERTRNESQDYAATWSRITPLRRVGQASDVASAVVFLTSEGASFIIGQTLWVDGGLFTAPY
jgi:3-oxoacyl-[acyl-carrier protein] reductase